MPAIDRHPAGNFCWLELATSDQNAAKAFYGSLFGWSASDSPYGPGAVYTRFQLNHRTAAAAFTIRPEEPVPPHWQLYIAVDDADATVRRAQELGAHIVHPAFDVMTYGRMAVLQDPAGAFFSIWQPRDNTGLGVIGENGSFSWADLQTTSRESSIAFYTALFGWQFLPGPDNDPSGYLHIRNGEPYIGGLPPARALPPGVPSHWLPYIQCADCAASTEKARILGARVLAPPMHIEGRLRFSVLADPQGAVFALFSSEQ